MKRMMALAALGALVGAGGLQAHHSGSMYQTTPAWIKGTVVAFEGINPHSLTTIEGQAEDGQVRRWVIEGPPQSRLGRGDLYIPRVGDVIAFCAFPYKSVEDLSRQFPDADFSNRPALAGADGRLPHFGTGHILLTPDGDRQFWEPHGVIAECIRSSDATGQSWVDFLNSSPNALQAWCQQKSYALVQDNASLKQFIDETNALIDAPC
jgi:Family of unknown function (DUF6152)